MVARDAGKTEAQPIYHCTNENGWCRLEKVVFETDGKKRGEYNLQNLIRLGSLSPVFGPCRLRE